MVTAINVALKAIAKVKSNIGDFEDLHDSQGHNSLLEAVSFIQDYPSTAGAAYLMEFNHKIDEMYEALDKFRDTVRDDIVDTGKFTLKRVKACVERVSAIELHLSQGVLQFSGPHRKHRPRPHVSHHDLSRYRVRGRRRQSHHHGRRAHA